MPEGPTISSRALDALVSTGLITADQLAGAKEAALSAGTNAGRVLGERGMVSAADVERILEDELGAPRVDLASYAPDDEALALVPASVARELRLLPLFEIEGMLTVALADPFDVFALDEVAEKLGVEIEAVLADGAAVAEAVVVHYPGEVAAEELERTGGDVFGEAAASAGPALATEDEIVVSAADFFDVADLVAAEVPQAAAEQAPTVEQVVEAPQPEGVVQIDLDVLAVADVHRVAVLVSEILEQAVSRGASRIHLLPYKDDFFLVFRIGGRLERVGSAPLSLQPPLIDGFKSYAKLGNVPASLPALGRLRSDIAGKRVVLTVSSVPTVAGQRLVVSLAAEKDKPRTLVELGMSEAEGRALHAMVERGRGLLLVAAPVAGGRSSTYYALLSHAAQVGKTVYSVERSIEYEIPAVAQVLVNPGSSVDSASYLAAGMRQDTDVLALDAVQTVEDVHLAIEAAGMGKLVIATFAGADIASAVRRMLDLGAEPVSLASALTLGVGQRVLRTNCPNCSVAETDSLAQRIPGAESGLQSRHGTGCPNCGKTGFQGATGIFEVLPFTEPVRSVVARGASAAELAAAAASAGMRPMVASGLAKVREGLVSAEELNRVLRFAD